MSKTIKISSLKGLILDGNTCSLTMTLCSDALKFNLSCSDGTEWEYVRQVDEDNDVGFEDIKSEFEDNMDSKEIKLKTMRNNKIKVSGRGINVLLSKSHKVVTSVPVNLGSSSSNPVIVSIRQISLSNDMASHSLPAIVEPLSDFLSPRAVLHPTITVTTMGNEIVDENSEESETSSSEDEEEEEEEDDDDDSLDEIPPLPEDDLPALNVIGEHSESSETHDPPSRPDETPPPIPKLPSHDGEESILKVVVTDVPPRQGEEGPDDDYDDPPPRPGEDGPPPRPPRPRKLPSILPDPTTFSAGQNTPDAKPSRRELGAYRKDTIKRSRVGRKNTERDKTRPDQKTDQDKNTDAPPDRPTRPNRVPSRLPDPSQMNFNLNTNTSERRKELVRLPSVINMKTRSQQEGKNDNENNTEQNDSKNTEAVNLEMLSTESLENLKLKFKSEKRDNTVFELLKTEQHYVRSLLLLDELWKSSLETHKKELQIDDAEIKITFGNLYDLLKINTELLRSLYLRLKEWNEETTISDVIKKLTPFFSIYSYYASNYQSSYLILEQWKKRPKLKGFLRKLSKNPRCLELGGNKHAGLDLNGFLIMPIQRVPRYCLFFERLTKETPGTHSDYIGIVEINSAFNQISKEIDFAVREKEEHTKSMKKLRRLPGGMDLLKKENRNLIRSGDLQMKVGSSDKKIYQCFLFSDILAFPSVGKFSTTWKIVEASVIEGSLKEEDNSFKVETTEGSIITIICESPDEKKKWVESFALNSQQEHPKNPNCVVCDQTFSKYVRYKECNKCHGEACAKESCITFYRDHPYCNNCAKSHGMKDEENCVIQ